MAHHVIRDLNGKVLFRDLKRGRNRRQFVQDLIKGGASLANANLTNFDLNHIRLDRAILDGAKLVGANLTGITADNASFKNCDMRGVIAPGIRAERADFTGADLRPHPETNAPAILDGSIMPFSRFDGAFLDRTDFADVSASSSTFIGARVIGTWFARATLHNVDWSHATIVGANYEDADLSPTFKIDPSRLPDRTAFARIVANRLKGAELGVGNAAFKRDRVVSKVAQYATLGAVSGGIMLVGSYIPLDVDANWLSHLMGPGLGFVAATGAISFLKEKVSDQIKERLLSLAGEVAIAGRQVGHSATRRLKALASLVVTYVDRGRSDVLKGAIARVAGDGAWKRLGTALGGRMEVIVCRRKVLAMALTTLTENLDLRGRRTHDIVIMHPGEAVGDIPESIIIHADGGMTALYPVEGSRCRTVTWDSRGVPNSCDEGCRMAKAEVVGAFVDSLLAHHGAPDLKHDSETHMIRTGIDGSVVVVRNSDGRVDNPYGPAILTPDDQRFHFRSGGQRNEPEPEEIYDLPAP